MVQTSASVRPDQPGESPPAADPPITITRIELPLRTILRVLLIIGVLWLFGRLWSIALLLLIAAFLAIAINPAVAWLQRHGTSRVAGVALVTGALLAVAAGVGLLIVPPLIEQGQQFAANLPDYTEQLQQRVSTNPTIHDWIQRNASQGQSNPTGLFSGALSVGATLVSGIVSLVLVTVLTIYLLIDGPRVYNWMLEMAPARQQAKLERVRPEVARVVSGYVRGQVFTSLLFGLFTFVVLTIAGVPQPLLLAVLAALLDAIPLIGATAATIPAVLLAATVSIATGAIVLVLYVAYQQLENYVITPRVYGRTLQISSLAALLAVLVGGTLLGVVGVLLALPIAAALPTIVRVWRDEMEAVLVVDDTR